jgi:hypothetical protein
LLAEHPDSAAEASALLDSERTERKEEDASSVAVLRGELHISTGVCGHTEAEEVRELSPMLLSAEEEVR